MRTREFLTGLVIGAAFIVHHTGNKKVWKIRERQEGKVLCLRANMVKERRVMRELAHVE